MLLIKLYQQCISPFFVSRCKYYPSCSQYSIDSIKKYGYLKGLKKTTKRIIKCNPWSTGGVDFA